MHNGYDASYCYACWLSSYANTFESRSGGTRNGGTHRQEAQGPHCLFFSSMTLSKSNPHICKAEENLSNLEHLGHSRRSWHALCRPCRIKRAQS